MKYWTGALIMMIVTSAGTATAVAQPLTPQPGGRTSGVRTLSVMGHGEAHVTPDTAMLDVAIETNGPTAQEAARRNAQLSQEVVSAIKADLGASGSVWTGSYALFPDYESQPTGGGSKLVGYRAENSINVRTTALDRVGALIDKAIGAGANRVNALTFTISNDSQARSEAISLAAKDAQSKAQALADALGVKLKRILSTSVEGSVRPSPLVMGARMSATGVGTAPTPIDINRISVPATVSLSYEIQ
jgi:uncharacterized protein YggE